MNTHIYYNIITLIDKDIISSYTKDWSNLRGWADLVVIPKNKIEQLINSLSIKRYGEIRDVINVIDFFIKAESDYVTGQVIYLGGV